MKLKVFKNENDKIIFGVSRRAEGLLGMFQPFKVRQYLKLFVTDDVWPTNLNYEQIVYENLDILSPIVRVTFQVLQQREICEDFHMLLMDYTKPL